MTTTEIQSNRVCGVSGSDGFKNGRHKIEITLVLEVILMKEVPVLFLLQVQHLFRSPKDTPAVITGEETMLFVRKEELARGFAQGAGIFRHDELF